MSRETHREATMFQPKLATKRWDPKLETVILERWEKEKTYYSNLNSGKPLFSIDTPPPYASGRWHVGGSTHYAQIDMVARYYRMKGYEVLFSFGVDRNGLPVEMEVEKINKIRAHETPRDKFLDLCKSFLDKVESEIVAIGKRLGMSSDFEHMYRTDSPEYRRLTQDTFIDLWHRGLVYEDDRPTNWCSVCNTTIADAEIEYAAKETKLCYVNFQLREGGHITIATTRPELICSCATVIYNPTDERYKELSGKLAITPIYNMEVQLRESHDAKPEFGTGLAMICSFGDYTDIRLFRELSLKPKIAISKDGRMNELAGPLTGLKVAAAREKMTELLKENGALVKVESVLHDTPICWRSKNPIEFIGIPEYYLKQLPFIDALKGICRELKFHPEEARQLLLNWINSVNTDWPISRRRYYGTEIPLWYCKKCGKTIVPPTGKYRQPWREKAPAERCECGSTELVGETRTFDTWMDSSISQLFILGYKQDEGLFKQAFPCGLRPQGADIVRTWLYYSLLRTYQLLSASAFRHIRISGMGLDSKGEAMHKSRGNVIWPEPILEKYGADAFRLWGAAEAKLGSNYRYSQERLEGSFKFITKLWNVSRFISSFPIVSDSDELASLDRMMLAKLNNIIRECRIGFEEMDFFVPAQALRGFVWNVLADHYVEATKARAYNVDNVFPSSLQRAAWFTLHTCLKTCLKLLAPITPFCTEAIWREVYSPNTIHKEKFPAENPAWDADMEKLTQALVSFDSAIWKFKKARNMALNEKLATVYAPEALRPAAADLAAMHKITRLSFGEPGHDDLKRAERIEDVYIILDG